MKHFTLIVAAALLAILTTSCGNQPISTRLMCYNTHNCVGLDGKLSCERIADVIKAGRADAVALQELDSMTTRYPGKDMLKELAELTGMHPTYAASIDYRGGKYGIGMLTKEKPISFRRVPLPCRSEPRSLLIVELKDYYYCCTHLSLHAEDSAASIDIIVDEISKLDKPVVVAGDFNAYRNEETMIKTAAHFDIFNKTSENINTIPADSPQHEIDFICLYTDKGAHAEVIEHPVMVAPVESDHCPIVAEVKIFE